MASHLFSLTSQDPDLNTSVPCIPPEIIKEIKDEQAARMRTVDSISGKKIGEAFSNIQTAAAPLAQTVPPFVYLLDGWECYHLSLFSRLAKLQLTDAIDSSIHQEWFEIQTDIALLRYGSDVELERKVTTFKEKLVALETESSPERTSLPEESLEKEYWDSLWKEIFNEAALLDCEMGVFFGHYDRETRTQSVSVQTLLEAYANEAVMLRHNSNWVYNKIEALLTPFLALAQDDQYNFSQKQLEVLKKFKTSFLPKLNTLTARDVRHMFTQKETIEALEIEVSMLIAGKGNHTTCFSDISRALPTIKKNIQILTSAQISHPMLQKYLEIQRFYEASFKAHVLLDTYVHKRLRNLLKLVSVLKTWYAAHPSLSTKIQEVVDEKTPFVRGRLEGMLRGYAPPSGGGASSSSSSAEACSSQYGTPLTLYPTPSVKKVLDEATSLSHFLGKCTESCASEQRVPLQQAQMYLKDLGVIYSLLFKEGPLPKAGQTWLINLMYFSGYFYLEQLFRAQYLQKHPHSTSRIHNLNRYLHRLGLPKEIDTSIAQQMYFANKWATDAYTNREYQIGFANNELAPKTLDQLFAMQELNRILGTSLSDETILPLFEEAQALLPRILDFSKSMLQIKELSTIDASPKMGPCMTFVKTEPAHHCLAVLDALIKSAPSSPTSVVSHKLKEARNALATTISIQTYFHKQKLISSEELSLFSRMGIFWQGKALEKILQVLSTLQTGIDTHDHNLFALLDHTVKLPDPILGLLKKNFTNYHNMCRYPLETASDQERFILIQKLISTSDSFEPKLPGQISIVFNCMIEIYTKHLIPSLKTLQGTTFAYH